MGTEGGFWAALRLALAQRARVVEVLRSRAQTWARLLFNGRCGTKVKPLSHPCTTAERGEFLVFCEAALYAYNHDRSRWWRTINLLPT